MRLLAQQPTLPRKISSLFLAFLLCAQPILGQNGQNPVQQAQGGQATQGAPDGSVTAAISAGAEQVKAAALKAGATPAEANDLAQRFTTSATTGVTTAQAQGTATLGNWSAGPESFADHVANDIGFRWAIQPAPEQHGFMTAEKKAAAEARSEAISSAAMNAAHAAATKVEEAYNAQVHSTVLGGQAPAPAGGQPAGITVNGKTYYPLDPVQLAMNRALEQSLFAEAQTVTGRRDGSAVAVTPGEYRQITKDALGPVLQGLLNFVPGSGQFSQGVTQAYTGQWVDAQGITRGLGDIEGGLLVRRNVLQRLSTAIQNYTDLQNRFQKMTDAQKIGFVNQLQKLANQLIPTYQAYAAVKNNVDLKDDYFKHQKELQEYQEQERLGVVIDVHESPFGEPSRTVVPPAEQAAFLDKRKQRMAILQSYLNRHGYQTYLNARNAFVQALDATNALLGVQEDRTGPYLFEQLLHGPPGDKINALENAIAQATAQLQQQYSDLNKPPSVDMLMQMGSDQYAQSGAMAAASGGDFTKLLVDGLQAEYQGMKGVEAYGKAYSDFLLAEASALPVVGIPFMLAQLFTDGKDYYLAITDEKNAQALAPIEGYQPVAAAMEARQDAGGKFAISAVTTGTAIGLQAVSKALQSGKNVKVVYRIGGKTGSFALDAKSAGTLAAIAGDSKGASGAAAAANDAKAAATATNAATDAAANSANAATPSATIASANPKVLKGLEVARNLGLKDVETYVNAINTPPTSDLTAGAALAATNNLMTLGALEEAKAAALAAGLPQATIDAIVNQAKNAGTIGAFAEVPRNLAVAQFVNDGNVLLMDTSRAGRVADYFREIGLPVQDSKAAIGLMGLKQEINFAVRNGRLPKLTSNQLALLRNEVIPNGNNILKWYTTIGNEVQPIFDQQFLKNLENALQQSANGGNSAAAQLLADLKFNTLEANAPALPGSLGATAGLTGNAALVDEIASSFGSSSYNKVLLSESIGGNAGPGHAAVNAVVDRATGQIIQFGNPQDLNPAILPANNPQNVMVSFRVRAHIGQTEIPARIDSWIPGDGLSEVGSKNINDAIAKYNNSLRGPATGTNLGATNPSPSNAAGATRAAGAAANAVNNTNNNSNTGTNTNASTQTNTSVTDTSGNASSSTTANCSCNEAQLLQAFHDAQDKEAEAKSALEQAQATANADQDAMSAAGNALATGKGSQATLDAATAKSQASQAALQKAQTDYSNAQQATIVAEQAYDNCVNAKKNCPPPTNTANGPGNSSGGSNPGTNTGTGNSNPTNNNPTGDANGTSPSGGTGSSNTAKAAETAAGNAANKANETKVSTAPMQMGAGAGNAKPPGKGTVSGGGSSAGEPDVPPPPPAPEAPNTSPAPSLPLIPRKPLPTCWPAGTDVKAACKAWLDIAERNDVAAKLATEALANSASDLAQAARLDASAQQWDEHSQKLAAFSVMYAADAATYQQKAAAASTDQGAAAWQQMAADAMKQSQDISNQSAAETAQAAKIRKEANDLRAKVEAEKADEAAKKAAAAASWADYNACLALPACPPEQNPIGVIGGGNPTNNPNGGPTGKGGNGQTGLGGAPTGLGGVVSTLTGGLSGLLNFVGLTGLNSVLFGNAPVAPAVQNVVLTITIGGPAPAPAAASPGAQLRRGVARGRSVPVRHSTSHTLGHLRLAAFHPNRFSGLASPTRITGAASSGFSATAAEGMTFSLAASGTLGTGALEFRLHDPAGKVKNVEIPEGVVLEPLRPGAPRPINAAPGSDMVRQLTAYCLDMNKLPPEPSQLYRIAPQAVQDKYRPIRSILQAGSKLAAAGQLHPDSDPAAYADFIRQHALWAQLENWGEQKFTEVFVERTKKNAEHMKMKWTKEMESALLAAAPGRWRDIAMVLEEAHNLSSAGTANTAQ